MLWKLWLWQLQSLLPDKPVEVGVSFVAFKPLLDRFFFVQLKYNCWYM